jgi:hypothetical protein
MGWFDLCISQPGSKQATPILRLRFIYVCFRYLLSKRFINIISAEVSLASRCATYLSFKSLDPLFSQDLDDGGGIDQQVKDGEFVFFEYAAMEWLEHAKSCLTHDISRDQFSALSIALDRLYKTRAHETQPKPGPSGAQTQGAQTQDPQDLVTLQSELIDRLNSLGDLQFRLKDVKGKALRIHHG